jgi:hypothetical protein
VSPSAGTEPHCPGEQSGPRSEIRSSESTNYPSRVSCSRSPSAGWRRAPRGSSTSGRFPTGSMPGPPSRAKSNLANALIVGLAPQPVALVGFDLKGGVELGWPSSAVRSGSTCSAAASEARVKARRGDYVDRNKITVGEYLHDWIETHAMEIKPRTLKGYKMIIRLYIRPNIGTMRVQAVRPSTITKLYGHLRAKGSKDGKPRSVNDVHAVLRKAFGDAVKVEELLTPNPVERAKRPKHWLGTSRARPRSTATPGLAGPKQQGSRGLR